MSSVSPSDGNAPILYHRDLGKVEDELRADSKRVKERYNERANELEKRYFDALQKKDEDTNRALENINTRAGDAVESAKEKYRTEVNQLKDQIYDSRGMTAAQDEANRKQTNKTINDFEKQTQLEVRKNREIRDDLSKKYQDNYKTEALKNEKHTNELMQSFKDSARESFLNESELYQSELDQLRGQIYNNRAELSASVPYELHKKEIQDLNDATERRQEIDTLAAKRKDQENSQRFRQQAVKYNKETGALARSHIQETKTLEKNLKTLAAYNNTLEKQKSDEVSKAVLENESANRSQRAQLTESYENIIGALRQDRDNKDDFYADRTNEIIKNSETKFANAQAKQTSEHHRDIKNLSDTFSTQVKQVEKGRKHDSEKGEELLHNARTQDIKDRDEALMSQAKQYQDSTTRTKKSDQDKIDTLQKALTEQKTTQDTSLISPGAENAIRKNLLGEYEKSLKAETERNRVGTDHIQRNYSEHLLKTRDEFEDKEMNFHKESEKDRTADRNQFLMSIQENEHQTSTKLREGEMNHEREKENIYHKLGNDMEQQKRQIEHSYETKLADVESKLTRTRQEADFNSKLLQRSFNGKQNELIRDYERKLADQREDFAFQMEDLKSQAKIEAREVDRKMKQEMDTSAKNYEQKIAQMEAQSKERERTIELNYQNELDRTKRTYEQLSKKKS